MAIERIDYNLCSNCGICADICPMDVFRKIGRICYIAHPDDCMTCFLCEMDCPKECIYVGPERAEEPVLPY